VSKTRYTEIEHTADWSLHIQAEDLEGLLLSAAEGMFQLMHLEGEGTAIGQICLEVEAFDREELLVVWLEELLFHIETKQVKLAIDELALSKDGKKVETKLEEFRISRLEKEIKAVTYHGLQILETPNGLEATVVFDV
jgi:SHS2 domain-containing protein